MGGLKMSTYQQKSFWNSSQEYMRKVTKTSWLTNGVCNSDTCNSRGQ